MECQLFVSAESFVEKLFQFTDPNSHSSQHRKFVSDMIEGIIASKSVILSNIARYLDDAISLKHREKRLIHNISNPKLPWEDLRQRSTEIMCRMVDPDDVIAFDPGDIIKKYSKKMENLYRVHDGSNDTCGNGYELFCVEAAQWRSGEKFQIPLYSKLINASCEDYIGQNAQICEAIHTVHEYLGDNRGIWTFDAGHDRSKIFEKAIFPLNSKMRWVMRLCENRNCAPENKSYLLDGQKQLGILDLAKKLTLSETPMRLTFPKKTGQIYLGWEKIKITYSVWEIELTLLVAHDRRNQEPVFLLSNLPIETLTDAITVFGYYLERWAREEGYRFEKSFLNLEDIRTLKLTSIQNLAWLSFMAYSMVTLFHRSAPKEVERMCQMRLQHFNPIEEVRFKYYRIAQLMRSLLWEQKGQSLPLHSMLEVG